MADPKYAELPGIAHDQPDCYETSDLPEADQSVEGTEDQSDAVERLHISANDAFGKFKGKALDAGKVDFSDRITRSLRTGYDVRCGEWEIAGLGEKETPLQKYQRLQCEVQELLDELQHIKGTISSEATQEKESAVLVAGQVELLQKQLVDMKLEEVLGTQTVSSLTDPQGVLQKKLMAQLESFKQSGSVKEKPSKSETASGQANQVTYELYYKPEQAKFNQKAKAAELDKRLERLENVIGATPEKLSSLSADTNHKSLLGALSALSSKVALLQPAQLDHVEGRLAAIGQKMNSVAEKKSVIEDAEKQNKVSELYDLVKKSEALYSALPDVVDRMVTLHALHEQALQFSNALTQLDTVQQQMLANLHNNEKLLKEMQNSFPANLDIIKNNISSLDARLAALNK